MTSFGYGAKAVAIIALALCGSCAAHRAGADEPGATRYTWMSAGLSFQHSTAVEPVPIEQIIGYDPGGKMLGLRLRGSDASAVVNAISPGVYNAICRGIALTCRELARPAPPGSFYSEYYPGIDGENQRTYVIPPLGGYGLSILVEAEDQLEMEPHILSLIGSLRQAN